MLQIKVPLTPERWDEKNRVFIEPIYKTLHLEHSLVSLSKWESKWHKSFLHTKDKTHEETIDYIKCMTITQNVDPDVYNHLSHKNIEEIKAYIDNPMTATTFSEDPTKKGSSREIITAELIYYWMIAANIPPEYQKWHLNRLITLIRVCSIKNEPPKKRSRSEIMNRNAALNAANRKRFNSKG